MMRSVFDPEDSRDYENGISRADEQGMHRLVANMAHRLKMVEASRNLSGTPVEVYVNYDILDLAVEMIGEFTVALCRSEC